MAVVGGPSGPTLFAQVAAQQRTQKRRG
ncbi:DUF6053 domain-containing protein [Lysobacter enzymogenes]